MRHLIITLITWSDKAIKQNLFPVEEKPFQSSSCQSNNEFISRQSICSKSLEMHLFSILVPLALLTSPILATPVDLEARAGVSHQSLIEANNN